MPDERFLVLQMHELLTYLNQQGVLTLLVLAQHGLVGPMDTPLDISYLSDAVIMLRYFEDDGAGPARAIGRQEAQRQPRAHDSRVPAHPDGIRVGPPLVEFPRHLLRHPPVHWRKHAADGRRAWPTTSRTLAS